MMKNKWKYLLFFVIVCSLICTVTAQAAGMISKNKNSSEPVMVTLNGEELAMFDGNGKKVQAILIDGIPYLPAEAFANALGLKAKWDSKTNTVSLIKETEETVSPTTSEVSSTDSYYKLYTKKRQPEAVTERVLSNREITALRDASFEEAAEKITTLGDAYAWLSVAGYSVGGMGIHLDSASGGKKGELILNLEQAERDINWRALNWTEMSSALNLLLEDDYEEVGTILCIVHTREPGWPFYYITYSYIRIDGVYYITSATDFLSHSTWLVYNACTIETNDLAQVMDALEIINGGVYDLITLAVYGLTTDSIPYEIKEGPVSVTFPKLEDVRYLYQMDETAEQVFKDEQEAIAEAERVQWDLRASGLKISDYHLPDAIGNTTLTYEQALALVGKDPEVIAKKVKTVGDVLQYMIAARFGYNGPNAFTPWYGEWGFDAPGDEQIRQNYGCCCGGYANAVSYLLRGDYEKIGTLRWVAENNNHTISWVYTDGKYYVFDFTQLVNGGNYNNMYTDITVLNDLRDYYDVFPDSYQQNCPKEDFAIMVAFETTNGAMYPTIWQDPPHFTGLTFPTEAKGKITLIYQKDKKYGLLYKAVPADTVPGYQEAN